jgi:lysophospholipase L1-like esterase
LGVPFLPVLEALLADPNWIAEARAGDGAHPGAKGYAAMAALVDQWPAWRAWLA